MLLESDKISRNILCVTSPVYIIEGFVSYKNEATEFNSFDEATIGYPNKKR